MDTNLPSFPALQAFESAARHLSFTAAAEELSITHSAVSHRIKILEDSLGVVLFRREARGVSLTTAGRTYLRSICEGLNLLSAATQAIRDQPMEGPLHISTTPVFADRWLIPRVNNFNHHYPGIELHITTSIGLANFESDGIDLAIRVNHQLCSELYAEPLFELDSPRFPVASPQLLFGNPEVDQPSDLLQYVLLHEDSDESWRQWFAHAGLKEFPDTIPGPRLGYCGIALQAARQGQGISLAYAPLAQDLLDTGELIRLLDIALPSKLTYSLVFPKHSFNQPRIVAFRGWLNNLVAASDSLGAVGQSADTAQKYNG